MSEFCRFIEGLIESPDSLCFPELSNDISHTVYSTLPGGGGVENVSRHDRLTIGFQDSNNTHDSHGHPLIYINLLNQNTPMYFDHDKREFQGLRTVGGMEYLMTLSGTLLGGGYLLSLSYHMVRTNGVSSALTHDGTIHPIP